MGVAVGRLREGYKLPLPDEAQSFQVPGAPNPVFVHVCVGGET